MNKALIFCGILAVANGHTLYSVVNPSVHISPLESHSRSSVSVNTPHYNYNYGLTQTKNHGAVVAYSHDLVPVVPQINYHVLQHQVVQPQEVKVTYRAHQAQQPKSKATATVQTFPNYVYTYLHPGHYIGAHVSTL